MGIIVHQKNLEVKMDKLQWFKFTPTDWIMGKIQRCPEITQARFLRLCCLYWNKECELSKEDAIIEIDEEHFKVLESKKIISCIDDVINISFLDEQFLDIQEVKEGKSKSGIIGNLKRWHKDIYSRFKDKKISLEDAIKESQTVAKESHTDSTPMPDQSHTDGKPMGDQSHNIAEKRREEKTRLEKIREKNRLYAIENCLPTDSQKNVFEDFLSYWFEIGMNDKKHRFEKQKSFDWVRRWKTWLKNNESWNKEKSYNSSSSCFNADGTINKRTMF